MRAGLPEVNFTNTDPQRIVDDTVSVYENLSGRTLSKSDPVYILILSMCEPISQATAIINYAAKQNLLYYAQDDVLDHKGHEWGTPRLGNDHATTTIEYTLSSIQSDAKIIPKGARITGSEGLFFETTEEVIVNPGETAGIVSARCDQPGTAGNGIPPGGLDTMVMPLPFVRKVENITISAGGTEVEEDDEYRERIRMAPEKLSVAGPVGAYEYYARKSSADIEDLDIDSPEPGRVHISMIMKGGRLPDVEEVDKVIRGVSERRVRPLTDYVTGGSPETVPYDIDVEYFIGANAVDKSIVQRNVEQAIEGYKVWQSSKIGRDINPSKLISMCIEAGAKRIEVASPVFTVVDKGHVAVIGESNISFGGEEDD